MEQCAELSSTLRWTGSVLSVLMGIALMEIVRVSMDYKLHWQCIGSSRFTDVDNRLAQDWLKRELNEKV